MQLTPVSQPIGGQNAVKLRLGASPQSFSSMTHPRELSLHLAKM